MKNTVGILITIILIISIFGCKLKNNSDDINKPLTPSSLTGKELSIAYCGSCHSYPEPSLLDSLTWASSVLPKMHQRLGLEQDSYSIFDKMDLDEVNIIIKANIYPEKPLMAKEDWEKIVKYYLQKAPKLLPSQVKKSKITTDLPGFKAKLITNKNNQTPSVTAVKFDTISKSILIATRGNQSYIHRYNLAFEIKDSVEVPSSIADIVVQENELQLLAMGKMDPNDQKKGALVSFNITNQTKKIVANNLQRPVSIAYYDLDNDKINDYIICQFGNELGKVTLTNGKTKKQTILIDKPGARNIELKDINNDGHMDITVLMTQANEQIITFLNNGKGGFVEKTLIQFPPIFGSTYFQLVDFNNDGALDILYSNGDNADLSIVLKPYHGIRIYLNNGNNNFKENYFYPMHGASKAIANDFDQDGDLDIAAISFFPDNNQKPNEGFLYLENNGKPLNFNVKTIKEASQGKWMVMDINDMDNDGDLDIILGSFLLKEPFNSTIKSKTLAIVLENKLKHKM
jgi:hypothetical protein